MKNNRFYFIAFVCLIFLACHVKKNPAIAIDEVTPWCILEFDVLDRTPSERMSLLKELGFDRYGYNWRERHLPEMQDEFKLAKENGIEITSIFLWLNADRDSLGGLSPRNKTMLNNLKAVEYKPTIWLSFSNNYFKELSQEESLDLALKMVAFAKSEADKVGCELALYNHSGWFGNPYNQISVIEGLKDSSITMVYNFHHAHDDIDEFESIVKVIYPYLSHVNLNGLKKDDEKILTLGRGDYELEMIELLIKEGFDGPWGILGHIKTKDVRDVLVRNIDGLEYINEQLVK